MYCGQHSPSGENEIRWIFQLIPWLLWSSFFTRASQWFLSSVTRIQSTTNSLRDSLILSSFLRLGLQNALLTSEFPTQIEY
jgi:hypothetical protein